MWKGHKKLKNRKGRRVIKKGNKNVMKNVEG